MPIYAHGKMIFVGRIRRMKHSLDTEHVDCRGQPTKVAQPTPNKLQNIGSAPN